MAMGARYERGLFDPDAAPDTSPFDHHVWVFASDGDLEEGITSEASSLAGTQKLGNLTLVWDDNRISIEDDTAVAFSEDPLARYAAYGWHVQSVDLGADGSVDLPALAAALTAARAESTRPSFIQLRTIIGWPAPTLQNTGKAHGAALGADEVAATKVALGFDPAKSFEVSDEVLARAREVGARGAALHAEWDASFAAWQAANPERAALLERLQSGALPDQLDLPEFPAGKDVATRKASSDVIQAIAAALPEFVGGSADLAESNNTTIEGAPSFLPVGTVVNPASPFGKSQSPYGRILHFGIREHAMGADAQRHGAVRAAAAVRRHVPDVQRLHARRGPPGCVHAGADVTYVWTHDSIGLGEDGPTHQPVEHLWALRAIPGLSIVRPADANETAVAWRTILEHRGPGRAGPHPPERADLRPGRVRLGRGRRTRRVRARRRALGYARRAAARHRLGGPARAGRPRPARRRGHRRPGRVDAVPGVVRATRTPRTASRCSRPR